MEYPIVITTRKEDSMMQSNYTTKGKHLNYSERILIQQWKNIDRCSNREIAKRLCKAPQTIHNEIKRGWVDLSYSGGSCEYSADKAQEDYTRLRQAVGATDTWIPQKEQLIIEFIQNKYSCEVMNLHPILPCASTIYSWIHKGWITGISSKDLLYPRKPRKYKVYPLGSPKKKGALSIEERPKEANDRLEEGHFEIDLVILNHSKGIQLLTLTDRKTRFEIIRILPDKSCASVNQAMKELAAQVQFKSITCDNGSEFMRLDEILDCPVYFAHPFASYERGSNENANRMIRRWIPKGCKVATPDEVATIQHWMNHYPRKLLNYRTSAQSSSLANLLL